MFILLLHNLTITLGFVAVVPLLSKSASRDIYFGQHMFFAWMGGRVASRKQTDIKPGHKFAVLKAFSEVSHLPF